MTALMIASPGYAAEGDTTGTTTATYISDTNNENENIKALDTQVAKNAADISTNTTNIADNKTAIDTNTKNIETNTTNIATNTKNIASNKTAIDQNTTDIATNKSSITSNKTAIDANTKNIETNTTNIATNAKNIATNTSDITNLKNLSNITEAGNTVIRKQAKQAVKVAATGNATVTTSGTEEDGNTLTYTINVAHDGIISAGDTNLVSGDTLYKELRSASGTYISAGKTTAVNLLALDTNLVNVVNALGLDVNDTTQGYTSKPNTLRSIRKSPPTQTGPKPMPPMRP